MKTIVEDFQNCDQFNSNHFYTLFHERLSESELKSVFSRFVAGEELHSRFEKFRNKSTQTDREKAVKLLRDYLSNIQHICLKEGENDVVDILERVDIKFATREEVQAASRGDCPQVWAVDAVNNYLLKNLSESRSEIFALREAFYGLENSFDLSWWLAQPLYMIDETFDPYIEIHKKYGAVYAITDTAVLFNL